MTDVGIREFKAHLSEFLERAGKGEVIRVTERGRPKAILGPLPGRLLLDQGVEEGWIRAGSEDPPALLEPKRSSGTVASALREDRGE
jgi:prevent-host-death family protein